MALLAFRHFSFTAITFVVCPKGTRGWTSWMRTMDMRSTMETIGSLEVIRALPTAIAVLSDLNAAGSTNQSGVRISGGTGIALQNGSQLVPAAGGPGLVAAGIQRY